MRRSLVAAALTASLLAPGPGSPQLLQPLWTLLSSLWSGALEKAGAGWDPFGLQAPAARPTSDAGGGADPDGRSIPAARPTTDERGGADPNG
jgi:hypothetical protein